jgi:hypothetical protein
LSLQCAELVFEDLSPLVMRLQTLDQGRQAATSRNGSGQVRQLPFCLRQLGPHVFHTRVSPAIVEHLECAVDGSIDDAEASREGDGDEKGGALAPLRSVLRCLLDPRHELQVVPRLTSWAFAALVWGAPEKLTSATDDLALHNGRPKRQSRFEGERDMLANSQANSRELLRFLSSRSWGGPPRHANEEKHQRDVPSTHFYLRGHSDAA